MIGEYLSLVSAKKIREHQVITSNIENTLDLINEYIYEIQDKKIKGNQVDPLEYLRNVKKQLECITIANNVSNRK